MWRRFSASWFMKRSEIESFMLLQIAITLFNNFYLFDKISIKLHKGEATSSAERIIDKRNFLDFFFAFLDSFETTLQKNMNEYSFIGFTIINLFEVREK